MVASGERCLDLSVRLQYADVPHSTKRDPVEAVRAAARSRGSRPFISGEPARVDYIGNYTAFHDLLERR